MQTSEERTRDERPEEEGGPPERGRRPSAGGPPSSHRYSAAERKRLLAELASSGETLTRFCARRGVSTATVCAWKRRLRTQGEAGLVPRTPARNAAGKTAPARSPEERRAAVEAFERSTMTVEQFARTFGISPWTLRGWLKRYKESGPKGLEPRRRGRPKGSGSLPRVAAAVREEVARTKLRFPDFGLKKIRDFLWRFQGLSVSTGTVARTLDERGIERAAPVRKRRKSAPRPRRFERAKPRELWQTDITSYVLARTKTRVYLVVFLDDHSRYVVSFGLFVRMRAEAVCEVLLEGIARYGKPREVLSDQGPQYFTWRGKSAFQKLLLREGVRHVVARSHHPQTVGKCERLWETVAREFWERAQPEDLADARARLEHFFAHYNFFRPHQGIDGAVPADRFFGAEEALRKTIEARLERDELDVALAQPPRKSVYLFGQIGDEQVSLHGERGELLVQTSSGVRTRMGLAELGASGGSQETRKDDRNAQRVADERDRERDGDGEAAAATDGQEAGEVCPAQADAARSPGAVVERHGGGAGGGAQRWSADPRDVARQAPSRGGGERALDPAAAGVADEPAGLERDAGGSPASAAHAPDTRGGWDDDRARGRSEELEEEARGAGKEARGPGRADPAPDELAQAEERSGAGHGGAGDEGIENGPSASGTRA